MDGGEHEGPTYAGPAHRPFITSDQGLASLRMAEGLNRHRLDERRQLLSQIDGLRRKLDHDRGFDALDQFTLKAIDIVSSPKAQAAFDVEQESTATRERYGEYSKNFLRARRLAEAGVSVVTLKVGDWDTHEHNFRDMREQLPQLDQGFHALVTDLYDRGLDKDVAVVLWGEFGRDPRISRIAGRDHWPEAGAAVLAGGDFKVGQVIGETDAHAARSQGNPYTPSNIFANLYRHLGIDPAQTLPDFNRRPRYILDDRRLVSELL
jgi:uncharacterized protein (DUF1501 family)